jgi:hypothetical protein
MNWDMMVVQHPSTVNDDGGSDDSANLSDHHLVDVLRLAHPSLLQAFQKKQWPVFSQPVEEPTPWPPPQLRQLKPPPPPPKSTESVLLPSVAQFAQEALLLSKETLEAEVQKLLPQLLRTTSPPPLDPMAHKGRLNKFVRRLHDMLLAERDSGIVEWRRGLLILHSTQIFSKRILPKYFNTM